MKKFRKTLKRKTILLQMYVGLILILIVCIKLFVPHDESFQIGFMFGVAIATEILAVVYIRKCSKALKNDDLLKQLYIKENDERYIYIKSQIGGIGFNIISGSLVIALIVSGFLNQTVFFSLFCVLIFSALVKGCLKLYFRNKV